MKIIWLLETVFIVLSSLPIALLPDKIALKVGEALGLFLFYIWGGRRKIAIKNIEKSGLKSLGDAEHIAKENFKNLGKSFAEIIKIYYGLGRDIIDNVEVRGINNYMKAKSKNRGVIFISGHCGNWELMSLIFGYKVDRLSVVARTQDNIYLNRLIEAVREKYGNRVIYKKGALKGIISELRKNGSIGILMDQAVVRGEGYVIDFLGRPAWTTKMPALIARKTGASVLPAFINRNSSGHVLNIYPEIELSNEQDTEKAIVKDTERFSGYIEDYIRQYPSEWLWIHRRWKRASDKYRA